jgi:beta-glucosidase
MQNESDKRFPKRFLWGAATSAHQVEGNNNNQWTVWERANAATKAAQAEYQYHDLAAWPKVSKLAKDPANYISGKASDHYHRYEEDFTILESLGLNAYRFSIEWSRIEPTEGAWNVEAIEHYRQYIGALKKRGIEPMMTLFHFSLPIWFADMGGFEKRRNVKYFVRFVEKVMNELGRDLKYIITINEPQVYVSESYVRQNWPPMRSSRLLAWRVLRNLTHAHNKAARLIHSMNRRYKVSIANDSTYIYPGDDAIISRISASIWQYIIDDYTLKRVRRTCDFIGVNYYFSSRFYGYRIHNEDEHLNDLGWDMHPDHLEYVVERLYKKYKLPIIVTESGLADSDDSRRKWWIANSMAALQRALSEGVDVRGYFHWSLLDNFEWAHGRWPDFGLIEVDYSTMKRRPRASAKWWADVLKKLKSRV